MGLSGRREAPEAIAADTPSSLDPSLPQKDRLPDKRERELSFSHVHHKILWLGPSSQKEVQSEFDALFGRRVVLGGEAYVTAPAETAQQIYRGMMAKKHHYPKGDISISGKGMLRSVLGPGHMARLDAYQDELLRRPGFGDNPESFICDVDHWPVTRRVNTFRVN